MAGEQVVRPIDVIGRLPDLASESLAKQDGHSVSIMRLGAITIDALDLGEVGPPTSPERQLSESCAALVLFFTRFTFSEDLSQVKSYLDTDPMVRFFCEGLTIQHGRLVLYFGCFTDPTRSEVRWISLPDKIENYFSDKDRVDPMPDLLREVQQTVVQHAWFKKRME